MTDMTPKEEERKSILEWLGHGLLKGTIFVLKWCTVAGIFILVSQYPEESKQIALSVAENLGAAAMWSMDWLSDLVQQARGHSNLP